MTRFDGGLRLEGERVLLRPFGPADLDAITAAMREGENFLPPNVPSGGDPLHWWLSQGVHDLARTGLGLHLAVTDRVTGGLSGAIGIWGVDWAAGAAVCGYAIRPPERGRGLATDALRTLSRWALSEGGLRRLELRIREGNVPSLRVAEKSGFRHEGLLRSADRDPDGVIADQHVFSLLAADLEDGGSPEGTRRLVGVGVGPGDPELVTAKGVRVLREADVVLVPVMAPDEEGRAESVVRAYTTRAERVVFALNDRGGVTERRAAAWDAAAERVVRAFDEGAATVAFATIGDPHVYSTFTYLAQTVRELRPGTEIAAVPGITAMQDLAARSGTVLAEGGESVTLVPMTGGDAAFAALRAALESGDTVVAYKFGSVADEVIGALKDAGRLDGAVYGARLGLPGEEVGAARELTGPVPYLSALIVPGVRRGGRGGRL
ncbi:hypothetical protein Acsp03_52060 [Actinomadura sp. NBRC 104412]|uniref:precorrin-2 C(20)-methyltransferase n=1 Tax=Actinomadura sp. NBRC 104412 TaxID=3032203 RepID=UPI0024A3173B|nr:precorrin-2 C(20)-methyltransferase [Actinomadura sp. NBRC 104412]GLZ07740.1 hypothetical protein Acsp03_52060 [Actinomadura sp. NBRC 104412]